MTPENSVPGKQISGSRITHGILLSLQISGWHFPCNHTSLTGQRKDTDFHFLYSAFPCPKKETEDFEPHYISELKPEIFNLFLIVLQTSVTFQTENICSSFQTQCNFPEKFLFMEIFAQPRSEMAGSSFIQ